MTASRKAIAAGGLGMIFCMQAVFTVLLSRPEGIRLNFPGPGAPIPRDSMVIGDAWIAGGIERIELHVKNAATGEVSLFPAERDRVKYKGTPVFALAGYRGRLSLASDGIYSLSAIALGSGGKSVQTAERMVSVSNAVVSKPFVFMSLEHLVPLILVAIACIAVPLLVRRYGGVRARDAGSLVITLVLWVDEIAFQIYWFITGAWTVSNSLMLHMCGIAICLIPIMLFTQNEKTRKYLFEIMYFWGLGGAVQALLTPDIGFHTIPEMKYFCFFISHGTIVLGVIYAAVVYRLDMTWKSLLRAFAATAVLTALAYGLDTLQRRFPPYEPGNYFVMGYPPPTGSVVDVFSDIFGPSPRYVVGLALMAIAVFTIIWLPFPLRRLARRGRRTG